MTRMTAGVALAVAALALTGCGTSGTPTAGSQSLSAAATTTPVATTPQPTATTTRSLESTPTKGTPASNAPAKCQAVDLKGAIAMKDSAAGNRYAVLTVTNTSGEICTMYGYGGLALITATGAQAPTDLTRTLAPQPASITLVPGGTAHKNLHWGVVPSGDEPQDKACEPESVIARIIPPDDTQSFDVPFTFGSVCAKGHIEGSAYFGA